jgi:hypothetical protein
MKKHVHQFNLCSYSGDGKEMAFRCNCGEQVSRPGLASECKIIRERGKRMNANSLKLFKIWHGFLEKFCPCGAAGRQWKWEGHELIQEVTKWAKKHPTVLITRCDDDCACGSRLVLIPCESAREYWGTSMVFIPQNGHPAVIHLYPGHQTELLDALKQQALRFKEDPDRLSSPSFQYKYGEEKSKPVIVAGSRIPQKLYKTESGIKFITKAMLDEHHSAEEVKRFSKWFEGQTGMVNKSGELGIYVWDYERWLRDRKPTEQGSDWD